MNDRHVKSVVSMNCLMLCQKYNMRRFVAFRSSKEQAEFTISKRGVVTTIEMFFYACQDKQNII